MTEDLPPPITFAALMAEATPAAQRASGRIWTDYNTHDPGVTFLEQTAFALTEIAYRADHPVRDHLTAAPEAFDLDALALFGPRAVLPGRPVTALDLAACLSALPEVARVFVRPAGARGLYEIAVLPGEGTPAATAIDAVAAAFEGMRLIGTDTLPVALAETRWLDLAGRISIGPMAKPEAIAAEVYHVVNLVLMGLDATGTGGRRGATRADLFDEPAAIWPPVQAEPGDPARPDLVLAALERIEGIENVHELRLTETAPHDDRRLARPGIVAVHEVRLPAGAARLDLTLDGAPVPLDPHGIAEEYGRLTAARIAGQGNRLDPRDFDVAFAGRPRAAGRLGVDATLPAIYRIRGGERIASYRGMIDATLGAMAAPLSALPARYAARAVPDPEDAVALRERREMLDYLIALQGEEMPDTGQTGLHAYRSAAERLRWDIAWREAYLARLPDFDFHKGTAHPEFGAAARLAHLCDLSPWTGPVVALAAAGLTLAPGADAPEAPVPRSDLTLPDPAHDLFLTRRSAPAPLGASDLAALSPWIADGRISPALLRRAASAEAYLLTPGDDPGDGWQLLFEAVPRAPFLYRCATDSDRAALDRLGTRLCRAWQDLNRACEQLLLIEDIRLRGAGRGFAEASVWALLPGWTARGADPAFRRHVEDMILRVAPAHVHVRPVWLDADALADLAPRIAAWQAGIDGAAADLRAALRQDGGPLE
ncbi:hypothetical protein [Rhodovulum visakhapatnamense]|uniref:Uncharacterized protein n=1 Tax=Rhodovulum visakhapatnamense TaxID=364297 RepID=A0A4R8G2W8_9RHOB|nr:hypothetical protein [Rhodovulum visakhapatnamense]TDX32519.1 hypothetical protein EV657_10388 [Rhodovulum visakhapatnamense]